MNLNCKDYQHQITLLLYDELPDGARPELEGHIRECAICKDVYESEQAMHSLIAEDKAGWDAPADLLVESRKALGDELDRIEKKRSWWRVPAFSVVFTPMRLLESAALVAMGLALGVYVSNQQVARNGSSGTTNPPQESQAIPRNGTISNLQVLNSDPATGQVEMTAEVSQPLRFHGRMEDNTTRQLLISALRNSENPGSRLKVVDVLSQKPKEESIEEVLISALIYDNDAGVRMRALESLKQYANEAHVRAAFMHALQNDENSGIRIGAINALTKENRNDAELAKSLQEVAKQDDNLYIRNKALQFTTLVEAGK